MHHLTLHRFWGIFILQGRTAKLMSHIFNNYIFRHICMRRVIIADLILASTCHVLRIVLFIAASFTFAAFHFFSHDRLLSLDSTINNTLVYTLLRLVIWRWWGDTLS